MWQLGSCCGHGAECVALAHAGRGHVCVGDGGHVWVCGGERGGGGGGGGDTLPAPCLPRRAHSTQPVALRGCVRALLGAAPCRPEAPHAGTPGAAPRVRCYAGVCTWRLLPVPGFPYSRGQGLPWPLWHRSMALRTIANGDADIAPYRRARWGVAWLQIGGYRPPVVIPRSQHHSLANLAG